MAAGIAAAAAPVCAAIADRAHFDLRDMALRQILCSSRGLQIVTQKVGDLDLIGDAGAQGPLPAGI
jgi:hypothetical protein